MLGDNLFHGPQLGTQLSRFSEIDGGTIFAYRVADPTAYGVVEFDDRWTRDVSGGKAEVSRDPSTRFPACTSMTTKWSTSLRLTPSDRGEYEITDVNRAYLDRGNCRSRFYRAGRPGWTRDVRSCSMRAICTHHRGASRPEIGVPEEAAWRRGFIGDDDLRERGELLFKSGYGAYSLGLLDGWGIAT